MREEFVIPVPPPEEAPLRLSLAGVSYCDGSYRIEREMNPTYVFEYVESGRGTLVVDGRSCHPKAGDVYLVPAWSRHCYASSAGDPWVKYWFNVSGDLVGQMIDAYGLAGCCHFPDCPLGERFRRGLARIAAPEGDAPEAVAVEVIAGIIAELGRFRAEGKAVAPVSPEGGRLRACLERHIAAAPPSLAELARRIDRSPVHAIRIFKRDFGMTPMRYLKQRKIAAACELLAGSERGIKEIARYLGFDDQYYFARLFKKQTGQPPGGYRRTVRGLERKG